MPLTSKTGKTAASEVIDKLLTAGFSKYNIAKGLGVSWRSIHNWSRRYFEPDDEMLQRLRELPTPDMMKLKQKMDRRKEKSNDK